MDAAMAGLVGAIVGALLTVIVTLVVNMVNNGALKAKIDIYNGWKVNAEPGEGAALERLRKQIVKRIRTMTWKDNISVMATLLALSSTCFLFGRVSSEFPELPPESLCAVCVFLVFISMLMGSEFCDSMEPQNPEKK